MALTKNTNEIARAIRFARRQLGTPYVWGGSAPGGFDCSGLVYWAYRKAGYTGIGRTTYDQIKQGIPVSAANLRPGDIVFPSSHHEGLYVGNGMVLEAPHTGDKVKLIPLSSFGFMTARRLIGGGGGVIPPKAIAGQSQSGLPVASPHRADRTPNIAAAIAALSSIRPVTVSPPKLALKTPQDMLKQVLGLDQSQPHVSDAFQPVQPPSFGPVLSPGGKTSGELSSSLDSARRALLGSYG